MGWRVGEDSPAAGQYHEDARWATVQWGNRPLFHL
jgi:hypothetical protein